MIGVEKELADSLRRKSGLLHLMSYPREARIYEEVSKREVTPEGFILDVTPEEYEKAGSKFAQAGLRLAEMGMPTWKTIGTSIEFPFIIIEEGADNGKEGSLFGGVRKDALWKLKEILSAVGVEIKKTKDGKVSFDKDACVGKQLKVLYVEQVDSRKPEEGGTGTKYTKATSAYPVTATNESLGI